MSTTKANIKVRKEDGWVEVLNQKGIATINNSCYYAYSEQKPDASINGNYTTDREVKNPIDSILWIRTNGRAILVTPNEA